MGRTGGWFGNSRGHSLAARGVRLYARKQVLMDPIFYANKREEQVPFRDVIDKVRIGVTFSQLRNDYPDADAEDLRRRGIKAVGMREGNNMLANINSNSVEMSVRMASESPKFKRELLETLDDPQQISFIHPIKVESLKQQVKR